MTYVGVAMHGPIEGKIVQNADHEFEIDYVDEDKRIRPYGYRFIAVMECSNGYKRGFWVPSAESACREMPDSFGEISNRHNGPDGVFGML